MPYKFKFHEPIEKNVRRIARDQFDLALAELNAVIVTAKGVHESRKALKRLRSLVRLLAPAMGRAAARRHHAALRDIARSLSQSRDQAVILETISKIEAETGPDAVAVFAPLRAHIATCVEPYGAGLDAECAAEARLMLAKAAKRLARQPIEGRGFAAIAQGLDESYRRGRKAFKAAFRDPSDEKFHALRKAIQWHWRQMTLLSRAWPEEFAVRVAAARELSQMLGDDHDLATLHQAARVDAALSAEQLAGIEQLCTHRQRALRAAARARTARLFAERPEAFVARMAAYWRMGRSVDAHQATAAPAFEAATLQPSAAVAQNQSTIVAITPEHSAKVIAAKAPGKARSQRRA